MSVLKSQRTLSGLEFYNNAIKLRQEITLLLLRDFGIKDKVRSVKGLSGTMHMEQEDQEKLQELMEKYESIGTVVGGQRKDSPDGHMPQDGYEHNPSQYDIPDA